MRRARERGSALLVALGILVVLSMMGVTFVILARMEMQAAMNFDNIMRARFIAEAGIERAIDVLLQGYYGPFFNARANQSVPYESSPFDSLAEPWAESAIRMWKDPPLTGTFDGVRFLEAAPANTWSGPINGRLGDGYYDLRRRHTAPATFTPGVNYQGGVLQRGVVDLNSLVNINNANETLIYNLLVILRQYVWAGTGTGSFNTTQAGNWAKAVVLGRGSTGITDIDESCFPGPGVVHADYRPYRYLGEILDRVGQSPSNPAGLPAWVLYGEDVNQNGVLDPNENNNPPGHPWSPSDWPPDPPDDGDGVLDVGLKDFITLHPTRVGTSSTWLNNQRALVPDRVYRPAPDDDYVVRWVAPVNLNTAPVPVIAAVLGRCGLGTGGGVLQLADAWDLATALVDYRNGPDDIDGINPATGVADDNPFDGRDDFRGSLVNEVTVLGGYDPTHLDPYVVNFDADGVDNDGDGLIDEGAAGTPEWGDDANIFPGGLDGFSELEAVLDGAVGVSGLSLQIVAYVKANATTRTDIDFDSDGQAGGLGSEWEQGCWTTPFRYDSSHWLIISEGNVERGGETMATARVVTVIEF